MKVLLVSEGKHEKSSLPLLVQRIAEHEFEFEHARLADENLPAHHGEGKGFFKKALRWLLKAREGGYEGMILVVDRDGNRERQNEVNRAQAEQRVCDLPRALGVAVQSFDAWMLADEVALSKVLGWSVPRQRDPESIRNPKGTCAELLAGSPEELDQSTMYCKSAAILDLAQLTDRCPIGFRPFAELVRALPAQDRSQR